MAYYFASVDCWQVTHADTGAEVFYFPDGRVEAHLAGGAKDTLLPRGAGGIRSLPGGGQVMVSAAQLCAEVLMPRPTPLARAHAPAAPGSSRASGNGGRLAAVGARKYM